MMLLSLLRVQDNNILPKWHEETKGLYFDGPEDGDLHIPSQPTCNHFYLWVEVPGQTLLCSANGLRCLFCLRAPPFTLRLKLFHLCVSFWETNTRKRRNKFYLSFDSCITYSPQVFWKVLVQKLCLFNLMKRKVLAKQVDSFEIKFDKKFV